MKEFSREIKHSIHFGCSVRLKWLSNTRRNMRYFLSHPYCASSAHSPTIEISGL